MSYYGQLTRFDPLLGKVPDTPFHRLSEVAYRARKLLKSRTAGQIDAVAKAIDFAIYSYFDEHKQNEIQRIKNDLEQILTTPRRYKREAPDVDWRYAQAEEEWEKFFEWDGGTRANGHWFFKESMESALDIPNSENTTVLEALRECEDWWPDIGREGFTESAHHELFATLSLWMIADAVEMASDEYAVVTTHSDGTVTVKSTAHTMEYSQRLQFAFDYALIALDAVCYAEHLSELERIADRTKEEKSEIRGKLVDFSELGGKGARIRHAPMRKLNEWALDRYHTKKWSSANAAAYAIKSEVIAYGRTIGANLTEENAQRTIAGWIRRAEKSV